MDPNESRIELAEGHTVPKAGVQKLLQSSIYGMPGNLFWNWRLYAIIRQAEPAPSTPD